MQSDEPQNCMDPVILQRLLKQISQEFKEESYNINKVVRNNIELFVVDNNHSYIHEQIIIFSQLLGATPKYFLELLDQEVLTSQTHVITLNSRNFQIASKLFQEFATLTKISKPSPYEKDSKVQAAMISFINIVAKRIAFLYQKLVEHISETMQKLTKRVKSSRMMNNFLLFKIFRELSESIKRQTLDVCTETLFRYCQIEVIEDFYRYTINKFETVKLFANLDVKNQLFEPSPLLTLSSMEKSVRVEIMLREAVRQDGTYAIFIKLNSSHEDVKKSLDDYLLFLDKGQKLRLMNCKIVRKRWFVFGDLKYNFKLEQMAQQYLVEGQFRVDSKRKDNNQPVQALLKGIPLENFTNTDGVIGRCLLIMKKYTTASDFFKDLSKRAILSKSIEEIMIIIPIVGFLIAAGSFTHAFYKIFSNHFSTDSKKLSEITGFVVRTGATVGTSIVGALIGQTLIPIPFVGALVGTVVGGLMGERGCRKVTSMISQSRFDEMINYFRVNLKGGCYWKLTSELLQLLQVKPQAFLNYIPKHMEEDVFVTIVGFVLVCFHESTRLVRYNQEREKLEEKREKENKKKKKSEKKGEQEQPVYLKEKEFEDEVSKLSQNDGFETEFEMNAIIGYLQEHHGQIYHHYDVLEKSILSFLSHIMP